MFLRSLKTYGWFHEEPQCILRLPSIILKNTQKKTLQVLEMYNTTFNDYPISDYKCYLALYC